MATMVYIQRRLHHGGWYAEGDDPMYWLLAIGSTAGLVVCVVFERCQEGGKGRVARFASLTQKGSLAEVDPAVRRRLERWVNGGRNMLDFWTGGFLIGKATAEQFVKVFETVALLCALLLTVGVTYFTATDSEALHLHGIVCCVANCSLLLGTLMSTFFAITFGTLSSEADTELFVGLMGQVLLRGPILMFVVGLSLLYSEMVLWFKITIDAGSACTLCLTSCLTLAPLFFHGMHKMGWATQVVNEEAAAQRRRAGPPTLEGLRQSFGAYLESKDGNCLALDRDEFLESLDGTGIRATSVQRDLAGQIFDAHVKAELRIMMKQGASDALDCGSAPASDEERSDTALSPSPVQPECSVKHSGKRALSQIFDDMQAF